MVRFSESPFKPFGAGARKDYRLVPGRSDAWKWLMSHRSPTRRNTNVRRCVIGGALSRIWNVTTASVGEAAICSSSGTRFSRGVERRVRSANTLNIRVTAARPTTSSAWAVGTKAVTSSVNAASIRSTSRALSASMKFAIAALTAGSKSVEVARPEEVAQPAATNRSNPTAAGRAPCRRLTSRDPTDSGNADRVSASDLLDTTYLVWRCSSKCINGKARAVVFSQTCNRTVPA